MNKDKIIQTAFIKLGEVHNRYNDNSSDQYKIAYFLLDDIIDNLAYDSTYLFNSTTVKLIMATDTKDEKGRYRYNIPNDFLNIITTVADLTIEGEFFYSYSKNPILTYCRKIDFLEYPNYLFPLLVGSLMNSLCDAYATYTTKKPIAMSLESSAKQDVLNTEGLAVKNVITNNIEWVV
jgi:hypothetical protein